MGSVFVDSESSFSSAVFLVACLAILSAIFVVLIHCCLSLGSYVHPVVYLLFSLSGISDQSCKH